MNDDYAIISININNDADDVIQFWKENFPNTSGFNHKYNWLYKNNIYENTFINSLQFNKSNTKVGTQGVSGRAFKCDNNILPVGLIGDFAVDRHHRALRPAMTLLKSTLKKSASENSFIYTFPNTNAIPVVKRAGYKLQKLFKRYVKINIVNIYIEKLLPSFLSSIISIPINILIYIKDAVNYQLYSQRTISQFEERIPNDVDNLWKTSLFCSRCLLQERNKKYIDWRMLGDKDQKTYFFILRDKLRNDVLGYVAYYIDEIANTILIVDFFAKDQGKTLRTLLVSFVFKVRYKKVNSISLEFLGPNGISDIIEYLGFKFRDDRPIFYVFNEKTSSTIKECEWFLTSWDEDAV